MAFYGARTLWEHQDFRNNWGFVSHALLPPGIFSFFVVLCVGLIELRILFIVLNGFGRRCFSFFSVSEEVYGGAAIPNRLPRLHPI